MSVAEGFSADHLGRRSWRARMNPRPAREEIRSPLRGSGRSSGAEVGSSPAWAKDADDEGDSGWGAPGGATSDHAARRGATSDHAARRGRAGRSGISSRLS